MAGYITFGSGSGDSGLTIPTDLMFSGNLLADAVTARNTFFTSHPTRLTPNVTIGLVETSTNKLYVQKYINSVWTDVSSVVQGPKGDTGIGIQGIQGEMGPAGIVWKGSFSMSELYAVNSGVIYNGSSYRCTVACIGVLPTNTSNWEVIASKGDIGNTGLKGDTGSTGPAGIVWKGDYSALSTYNINDGVLYLNSSYRALQAVTGVSPLDATSWEIIAKKGTDGVDGEDGLVFRGTYNNAVAYVPKDAVNYNGSTYICKLATTGNLPTQAVWWDVFVSKGADGDLFDFKGGYVNTTTYLYHDLVTYNGSTYVCHKDTGSTGNLPTDTNFWTMVASKGDTGVSGVNAKGNYSGSTTYLANDLVTYNGASYICTQASTGNLPTNTTYWTLFVAQGAQGDPGPTGPVGMSWQGTWSNVSTYAINDAVYYNKSSYIALKASTNVQPGTDATTWTVLAQAGEMSAMEDRFALDATTSYIVGNVVSYNGVRYTCRTAHTTDAVPTFIESNWVPMSVGMVGATSSVDGKQGLVPQPTSTSQDAKLLGSGEWDKTGRKTLVTLTNFTANTSLVAADTVDKCEVIAIPQSTSGITIGVPSPTANTKVRKLIFINTGSTSFSLSTGHTVYAGKWVELYWALALQSWETYVGDTKIYNSANAYQAYDRCILGNITVYSNAAITAGTTFAWGTAGSTWAPVIPEGYVWRGVYAPGAIYNVNDLFTDTSAQTSTFHRVTTAFTATTLSGDFNKGGAAINKVVSLAWGVTNGEHQLVGATSTVAGGAGVVSGAAAGKQDATLKGDGDWDVTGKGVYLNLSNYATNTTLTASSTVDLAEYLIIPQTTVGVTLTLPSPTTTTITRKLHIVNTGTTDLLIGTTTASKTTVTSFTWPAGGSAWIPQSGGSFSTSTLNRYSRYMNNGVSKTVTQNVPFTFENVGTSIGSDITYSNGYFGITNSTTSTQYYDCCFDGFYFNYSASGYGIVGMYVGTSNSTLGTFNSESSVHLNSSYRTTSIFEDKQGASRCTISVPAGTTYYVTVAWVSGTNIQNIWNGRMSIQQVPATVAIPASSIVAQTLSYSYREASGSQTSLSTTTPILFANSIVSKGTGITYNNGVFTVPTGKTFKLTGHVGCAVFSGTSGRLNYAWFKSTDGTNYTKVGNEVIMVSGGGSTSWSDTPYSQGMAVYSCTTAAVTYFKLLPTLVTSVTNIGGGGSGAVAPMPLPAAIIEEVPSYSVLAIEPDSVFGTSIEHGYYGWSADQAISVAVQDLTPSITKSGTIPNNNGVFSLTGGKTYEIDIGLYGVWSGNGVTTVNIVDATTNVSIPGSISLGLNSASGGSYSTDPGYKFIYTPSANQTIKLRTSESSFNCQIMSGKSWVSIKQLPTATVVDNATTPVTEWTSYTPTITGSTTNPTLATTKTLSARYKVVGKSLHLAFTYFAASATGAALGSGAYLVSLPSGFTINTSIASLASTVNSTTGSYAGFDGSTLGSGMANYAGGSAPIVAVGAATDKIGFVIGSSTANTTYNTMLGAGNFNVTINGMAIKVVCEIPIN